MGKLDFLGSREVTARELREARECAPIIDGFLLDNTISVIYANKGAGKSRLALAVSARVCSEGYETLYIDTDNGIGTAKDRGLDRYIEKFCGALRYVNSDRLDDPIGDTYKLLAELKERARENFFEKVLVVFDTLAFFCGGDLNDEGKLNRVFSAAKAIRRAGGTVIILSHSTKKGEGIKGSGTIETTADTIFEIRNVNPLDKETTHVIAIPEKFRFKVFETGYSINNDTLAMAALDPDIAKLTAIELELAERIEKEIVKHEDGISQNALLEAVGLAKNDRTGMRVLELFCGKNWSVKLGKRNAKIYKKVDKRDSVNTANSREQKPMTTSVHTVHTVAGVGEDEFIVDVKNEIAYGDVPQGLLLSRLEKKYKKSMNEILKELEKYIGIHWERKLEEGLSIYKGIDSEPCIQSLYQLDEWAKQI